VRKWEISALPDRTGVRAHPIHRPIQGMVFPCPDLESWKRKARRARIDHSERHRSPLEALRMAGPRLARFIALKRKESDQFKMERYGIELTFGQPARKSAQSLQQSPP
jgi:hypothetical protein